MTACSSRETSGCMCNSAARFSIGEASATASTATAATGAGQYLGDSIGIERDRSTRSASRAASSTVARDHASLLGSTHRAVEIASCNPARSSICLATGPPCLTRSRLHTTDPTTASPAPIESTTPQDVGTGTRLSTRRQRSRIEATTVTVTASVRRMSIITNRHHARRTNAWMLFIVNSCPLCRRVLPHWTSAGASRFATRLSTRTVSVSDFFPKTRTTRIDPGPDWASVDAGPYAAGLMGRLMAQLHRWWAGSGLDLDRIDRLRAQADARDPLGRVAHPIAAGMLCLGLTWPISIFEFLAAPVLILAALRLWTTWRLYPPLLKQPVVVLGFVYVLWWTLGLAWSGDRVLGLDELESVRWFLVPLALWPVLRYRQVLLICFIVGVLVSNSAQLVQALAFRFGWEHLDFDAYPDRISAWMSPASGGSLLAAAFGLTLPAAFLGRGAQAWIMRSLSAIFLLAIVATGARGAWIASALLLFVAIFYAVWRSRRRVRLVIAAAALIVVMAPIVWLTLGGEISSRVREARHEITGALESHDYATSTGARINMLRWAGRALTAHPVIGVGTGGYRAWVVQHQRSQDINPEEQPIADHAHNTYAHIAATQGTIGLILAGMLIAAMLRSAWPEPDGAGALEAGIFFAIVGMLLAGGFDAVHINTQTMAMLATLTGLAPVRQPSVNRRL
ncbi:MAG TPA: O-antigen ligase family protein [Phycisphaerales bacterium]|nr:O-antigen ligase family protein [Phycisphaerales bacterium]